jgi:hypothetical protein
LKRLLFIPIVMLLLCLWQVPVFAEDPPDTDVDIGVSSPGDVDLDVNVNAGGDTNVNINGNDLNNLATNQYVRDAIYARTSGGAINYNDWWRYKGMYLDPLFRDLYVLSDNNTRNIDLALTAVSRLILDGQVTDDQLAQFGATLHQIRQQMMTDELENSRQVAALEDQLLNGAEFHIALLQGVTDTQGQSISDLQAQVGGLDENLAAYEQVQVLEHRSDAAYLEGLRQQILYAIAGLIAGFVVLLALVVWLFFKTRTR